MIRWQLPETGAARRPPRSPEVLQLTEEMPRIHDDPVGDHRGDVRIQDARGDELELQQPPLRDHRVPGVVAALVADDEVHPVREVVDGLALALVPPLGPETVAGICRSLTGGVPAACCPSPGTPARGCSAPSRTGSP